MKRYIDAEILKKAIMYYHEHTPDGSGEHCAYGIALKEVNRTPTADVVHIDEVFRLIAGHSNYHGDAILSALMCVAEGKEVKPIKPLTDVVEVVRCKDCRYYTTGLAVGMCKRVPSKPIFPCCYDNYCGWGERRDT